MTNALKSKIAKAGLGLVAAASLLIGAVSVSAYTFNTNLKLGMKGSADVVELQKALGVTPASGYFGPLTLAAVKAYQGDHGIPNTGYVGPLTRTALNAGGTMTGTLPAGCTSTTGYSTTTGQPCTGGSSMTLPAGCTSTVGFSPTTGQSCSSGGSMMSGPLSVSLASDNPSAMNIPLGATGVPVLKVMASGTGTVSEVVITRSGLGNANEFSSVYLYNGANRLTSGRTISSDSNTVTFSNLNLTAPVTLTVKVDSDSAVTTGGYHTFTLSKLNGNAVSVKGNEMWISTAVTVSTVTVDQVSSSWTQTLGGTGVEVAKFSLATGSTSDTALNAITLRQGGTLSSTNLKNLKLVTGSTTVATADSLMGDKLVFSLTSPYTITKGQTKNFSVLADITGGRSSDTIQFYVDEKSDVATTDLKYNAGTIVINNFALGDQVVTMQGGQLTISKNGPSATTYAAATNNNSLMNLNLMSERNITVRKIKLTLTTGGSMATGDLTRIKNIRVVDTDSGSTLVGPITDLTSMFAVSDDSSCSSATESNGGCYKVMTDSFDMGAGQTRHLAIQADFDTSTTDATTLVATFDMSGTNYAYDNDSGQYVSSTNIVPATTSGSTMTVSTSSVTISALGTPASTSVVKGASNLDALGVNFAAGTSDSLTLNRVIARIYADDDGTFDNSGYGDTAANTIVQSVSLVDAVSGTVVKGPVNLSLVGTIGSSGGYYKADFNTLNLNIAKGEQKKLVVRLNMTNTYSGTKYVAVDLKPSEDVEIQNSLGNSLTSLSSSNLNLAGSPSPVVTAKQNGTLTVAVDGNTPQADVVVTGSTGVITTKYKFTASNDEAFEVKGLSIVRSGGADADIGAVKVTYVDPTGATVTKTSYLSGGALTFNDGSVDVYVPKGNTSVLTISADLNTVSAGATSGNQPKLCLNKQATDCGASANLTDAFIAYGSNSGQQILGNTDSVTLVDTTVNAMKVAKTKVTATNSLTGGASTILANQIIGRYTLTSTGEGTQNSTLNSVTISMSGSLIAGSSAGDDAVAVKFYKNSISTGNLLNSTDLTCSSVDAGVATCAAKTLDQYNEFSGTIDLLVVVDTTDADFSDTTGTQGISTQLVTYQWNDGVGNITPASGIPVTGGTLTY